MTRLVAVDGCDLFLGLAVMLAAVRHFRDVCLAAVWVGWRQRATEPLPVVTKGSSL